MKKSTVYIIIVNYQGHGLLHQCLKSIRLLNITDAEIRTIVVDNGPIAARVQDLGNIYRYIRNKTNLGFTGANNIGIRIALNAGADYVWLVNNDTILHEHAACLIHAFDVGTGIAGSKILFAKGHEYHHDRYRVSELGRVIWYAGGIIDWRNMYGSHRGVDEVDHAQYDQPEETDFVSGCSMMISAKAADDIGLLDDRYFLYLEDLDYCLRAKRKGWKVIYYPDSVLWHENAGSSGGSGSRIHEYYMTRNRLLVGLRYAPLRTKLALARESLKYVVGPDTVRRQAVLDAVRCRYGKKA